MIPTDLKMPGQGSDTVTVKKHGWNEEEGKALQGKIASREPFLDF